MGLLDSFRRKSRIGDTAALSVFLDRQSAFMVQKCIYEYARARSGLLSPKLFEEAAFRTAVEESKWRNYPLCLQSVALMVEGALRPDAAEPAAMRYGLIGAVDDVCRRYPPPAGMEADFWVQARDRIARRMHGAGLAVARAVKDIPEETAEEFFRQLPIHPDLRSYDFVPVTNNLRGNLCRAYEEFVATTDRPALTRALSAAGGDPA